MGIYLSKGRLAVCSIHNGKQWPVSARQSIYTDSPGLMAGQGQKRHIVHSMVKSSIMNSNPIFAAEVFE